MSIKTILAFVVTLALSVWLSADAGAQPKPANAAAESSEEVKAKAAYEAAEKAAKEAEAAVLPLKTAMQKADTAYANASKTANTKRQQATDAKNLAGEQGVAELKQAETNLPAAVKALTEATDAKPGADKALVEAKAAAQPLQQAYDAAEKVAKAAEAAAKVALDAANKLDDEAKKATAQAVTKRRAADAAKAAVTQAQRNEQQTTTQIATAAQKLSEAEAQKKAADEAFAKIKNPVPAATTAHQAAEQAALAAEANAKVVSPAEKQQAASAAAAQRKAADAAKTALTQAQQNEQQAQARANAAAQKLAGAPAQKKAADEAWANAKKQAAAASGVQQAAERAAQAAEAAVKTAKTPEEKKKAADDAAAKRKAADAAKTAVTQAQQSEQQAQAQVTAAAKNLADAPAQKKAADEAWAGAKKRLAAAAGLSQSAEQAAQAAEAKAKTLAELAGRSEAQKQQAAADADAKRKAADAAKAVLAEAQAVLQNVQGPVNTATQKLARATAQKKVAEAALVNIKKQIVTATATAAAAEKAAEEAAKVAEEKKQAAAQAAAKRKAAADAAAALDKARQGEQQAQAQADAAAKALAGAPAPKRAEAEARKKAADAALANAKNQVAAADAASKAAVDAGKEFVQLEVASKQAAADAAAKRKEANAAKATLAPVRKKLEQAAIQANSAAQKLTQAESRKKSAEETLESLKKRIASAKQTHVADEEAAKAAEATAAPLKVEAEKTREAYAAALKVADDKRALAEQAKAAWYRLAAARQVASLMDSAEPPKPANRIDEIVFAKLASLGIKPILCSDAVFIRRVYLDLTGKLPSAEEAKAFIQSADKNKRAALVDRLLDDTAHVDYWAMKWSDILRVKAEFPVKVWPNAAQAYYRWVWESIAQNKPYDKFARELLTSSGSNFRVGPVNFYRAIQDKTPEGIAGVVSLAFMGSRVHLWPAERRTGMAAFFSQVGYKPTSEWKEEIVFWDPLNSVAIASSTAAGIDAVAKSVTATNQIPQALEKPLSENGPLAAAFPDGTKVTVPPDRDPREVFAEWLIRPENPWFARAIVNRTWSWAMGRGIIHEADDVRPDNPPSNPELLAHLEKELVSAGYDLKRLKRLIFTSTTYQLSSMPRYKTPEARANFASYLLRRVEAEVLIDALNNITGSADLYTSAVPEPFTYIPHDMTAVELADGSISSTFLTLFGRSSRSTGMETERVNELASPQWLHMLNSATLTSKLQNGPKLAALISAGGKPTEIAERLYLTILSRLPSEADLAAVEIYTKMGVTRGRDMWIDLAWALLNSPEFLLRH
jgi:hypothetical protein